jgi:hypothetical protein
MSDLTAVSANKNQELISEVLVLRAKLRDLAVEHVELQRLYKNMTVYGNHWFNVANENGLVDNDGG